MEFGKGGQLDESLLLIYNGQEVDYCGPVALDCWAQQRAVEQEHVVLLFRDQVFLLRLA